MQEFLSVVLYPSLFAFLGIAGTKLWDWIKTKNQKQIDNASAKSAEIDAEVKAADFYKSLLDDAKNRIDDAFKVIEERDKIIKVLDEEKREMQKRFRELIEEIETLTTELKKYKQLNGKQP